MAAIIDWYIPDRVAYILWPEIVTWEMIMEAHDSLMQALEIGIAPVHILGDARFTDGLSVLELHLRREKNFQDHQMLGFTINVAADPATEELGNILPQKMRQGRYRSFLDIEDALHFLAEKDETLNWQHAHNQLIPGWASSR